jgi:hypothetical protein
MDGWMDGWMDGQYFLIRPDKKKKGKAKERIKGN